MYQRKEYEPWQQAGLCFYCGNPADTKDHIPSKVLLDEPFPDNMYVVPCCRTCNNGFSPDEEYSAVAIECIVQQSTEPCGMRREKARKIIEYSPLLLNTVKESLETDLWGHIHISSGDSRFRNFITKLAKAHVRYELGILPLSLEIDEIKIIEWKACSLEFKKDFTAPQKINILPETGSRSIQLMCFTSNKEFLIPWIPCQENMYAYFVNPETYEVRILIQDTLAVRVRFKSDTII